MQILIPVMTMQLAQTKKVLTTVPVTRVLLVMEKTALVCALLKTNRKLCFCVHFIKCNVYYFLPIIGEVENFMLLIPTYKKGSSHNF